VLRIIVGASSDVFISKKSAIQLLADVQQKQTARAQARVLAVELWLSICGFKCIARVDMDAVEARVGGITTSNAYVTTVAMLYDGMREIWCCTRTLSY
jgi:hypothetical protein